jgi:Tfp pilus assembly protein PilF
MRLAAAILAGALLFGATPAAAQNFPTPPSPEQRLVKPGTWEQFDTWLNAILRHEPGRNDAALREVLTLTGDQLESVFPHMVFTLRAVFNRRQRPPGFDGFFGQYGTAAHRPQGPALLTPRVDRVAVQDLTQFLKRAAMLHADIAMFTPGAQLSIRAGESHLLADGSGVGLEGRTWHWMVGRAFLHLIPDAEKDADVRLWYQVAASHLWSIRQFSEAAPHIRQALELFPDDAEIQFVHGLIREAQGSPNIQAAVEQQMAVLPRASQRFQRPVKSADFENGEAREAFQKAVRLDPSHTEARVRFARHLILDGKPEAAITELRAALGQTEDKTLRYLAQLFLGRANELLHRDDEARAAYDAASSAFPEAQSPRLALSQLAIQAGDRDTARSVLAFLAEAGSSEENDPWWDYYYRRQIPDDVLVARLRAAFLEAVK